MGGGYQRSGLADRTEPVIHVLLYIILRAWLGSEKSATVINMTLQ